MTDKEIMIRCNQEKDGTFNDRLRKRQSIGWLLLGLFTIFNIATDIILLWK